MRFLIPLLLVALPAVAEEPRSLTTVATLGKAKVFAGERPAVVAPDCAAFIDDAGTWYDGRTFDPIDPPFPLPKKGTWHAITTDGAVAVTAKNELLLYPKGKDKPAHSLAIRGRHFVLSADGRTVVAHDPNDGELEIATRVNGEKDWQWVTHFDDVPMVSTNFNGPKFQMNDAGTVLAWAESKDGRSCYTYDVRTKAKRHLPRDPKWEGTEECQLSLSADGSRAWLRAHFDGKNHTREYDAGTGKAVAPAAGGLDRLFGLAADVWDRPAPTLAPYWHHHLLPGGDRALTFDAGVPRLHDLRTGKRLDAHSTYDPFVGVATAGPKAALAWTERGRVVNWSTDSGKAVAEFDLPPCPDGYRLRPPVVSPDGTRLSIGTDDGYVVLDTRTGKTVTTAKGRPLFLRDDRLWELDWRRSKEDIDAVTLTLRDPASGRQSRPLTYPSVYWAEAWALSPDGRVAVSEYAHKVTAVEVATGAVRWEADLTAESVREDSARSLRVSADGRTAVLVRTRDVFAFDLATGHNWGKIEPDHNAGLYRHAVSGDGRWLVWYDSHRLQLCDLIGGGGWRFPLPDPYITGVAISPERGRLVTSHRSGLCRSWDISKWTATELPARDPPKIAGEPAAAPWAALADADAKLAGREIARLVRDPDAAMTLLGDKLEPVRALDDKLIRRWIADLGDPDFKTRDTAGKALATVPDQAAAQLRDAAKAPASAEAGRRIAALLKIDPDAVPDTLRSLRAMEVLEHVGTAAARRVVATLADGAATAAVTRHAAETLARMRSPAK